MLDKEYIKRNSLIENLRKFAPEQYTDLINQLILKQPTEDVQSVVHAKWIKGRYGDDTSYSICSNCKSLHNRWISYRYCLDCGAKMDKE